MANPDSAFGLRPIGMLGGGELRTNVYSQYTLASALNATLDKFSPVVLTGTGTNITAGAGTSEYLVGSFAGCEYIDTTGKLVKSENWVAQTATKSGTIIKAFVYDDPQTKFLIQGNSETWVTSDVGLNVDYTVGTRKALTNTAGTVAVRTGINTTATLMLRILELARDVSSSGNAWGAYARLVVQINAHRYRTLTGA